MTWQPVAVAVLLAIGVGIQLACALGMLVCRDVFDQLHFVTPAATVGLGLSLVAVLVKEWLSPAGVQMLVAAVVLFLTSPVLAHATARVAHVRRYGTWLERPQRTSRRES